MNMDVPDDEIPIPAYLRKQASRDAPVPSQLQTAESSRLEPLLATMDEYRARCEREARPPSTGDFFIDTGPRWVFVKPSRGPIHPRSLRARMLRAADRRRGTTDSLTAINYGPVELRLRKLLALFNWRRWWR
jgi:hypothetical protein